MVVSSVETDPWVAPRRRAEVLRERHDFGTEVLTLYLALLEVWQEAWVSARAERSVPLASWAAERVLPQVVAATARAGPPPLVEALMSVQGALAAGAAEELMAAWLAGDELAPVERYLARASLRGPLTALDADTACAGDPSPRGERHCPRCGGPPQLSFRTDTGDRLVSGQRMLQCARCGESWRFSTNACPSCGEAEGGRRTFYAEQRDGIRVGREDVDGGDGETLLPHLRLESCATCRRYLVDVDLGRDPLAVPEVDELVALPLDLYAAERGLTKITPNLMGF